MTFCKGCNVEIDIKKTFCGKTCYGAFLKTRTGVNNPFFGKKHNENTISKLAEKAKKRTHTEETKLKISQLHSGKSKGPMKEETKQKLSESIKKEYLDGRVVWNKNLTKETNEFLRRTSEKLSEIGKTLVGDKNPFFGKHHSDENRNAHSQFMKGKFIGGSNAFFGKKHTSEVKKSLSNYAIIRSQLPEVKARLIQQGITAVIKSKKINTDIEVKIKEELDRRNVRYDFQYKFRNSQGQYICVSDFAFPKQKVILEVHGDFHHANPKIYSQHNLKPIQLRTLNNDVKKADIYKSEGWTLVILWGLDIKKDVTKCVDYLLEMLSAKSGI